MSLEIVRNINYVLSVLFFVCYFYQILFILVPFFFKLKKHKEESRRLHRYAVLISARNEEAVIANLLESIAQQDYPSEYVTTFVVADNCTDRTADIARRCGAVVYERFNRNQVGKGYAMNYLLSCIGRDYAEDYFDAYMVFDADNVLSENYITEMNKTYCDGYEAITSYRNSKNYGDNWISAGYALWFLREAKYLNHARMALGTSCAISGTGFMFSNKILKECGGWNFFLLTEDIEFTVCNVINGRMVGYCPTAELYDEQPVTFRQSWRQRLRWAKGYLQVFRKYGSDLMKGIFKGNFSCFDMTMAIMPAIVLTMFTLLSNGIIMILGISSHQDILVVVHSALEALCNAYSMMFVVGAITTITEWSKIHTTTGKKLLYMLTFPVFMLTYIPISITALFAKVEWKPIEHKAALKLSDIKNAA